MELCVVSARSRHFHGFPQHKTQILGRTTLTEQMESANWEHAKPLTNRPTATMSVALPLSRQVPAAQDFIGIPRIFESQLILRINNSKTVGQKSMTLTPYFAIFYEQVLAAQDFAKIATTSRTQLHENKDFRYQQEKNVCSEASYQNRKADPEGLPDSYVPEAQRLKPEALLQRRNPLAQPGLVA